MNPVWQQFIQQNYPVMMAAVTQITLLLLPVPFKSWRYDGIFVLTYASIHAFIAGLLFIVAPKVFDLYILADFILLTIITGVFMLACWRSAKVIPLEATSPFIPETVAPPAVNFDLLYSPERLKMLGDLIGEDSQVQKRQRALREMLTRRRVEPIGLESAAK